MVSMVLRTRTLCNTYEDCASFSVLIRFVNSRVSCKLRAGIVASMTARRSGAFRKADSYVNVCTGVDTRAGVYKQDCCCCRGESGLASESERIEGASISITGEESRTVIKSVILRLAKYMYEM